MKAILEFDLDNHDEKQEHLRCIKSLDMASALFEIQCNLQRRCEGNGIDVFEEISKIIDENNLNIEELIS